jgi:Flp pilus assembly protein TadG
VSVLRRGRHDKGQRGIVSVEFALALPLFAMMLFGIAEFGMAFYKQQIITAAVREGARYGSISNDPKASQSEIVGKVIAYIESSGLDAGEAQVGVNGAGGSSGQTLTVTVSYPSDMTLLAGIMSRSDASTTAGGGFDSTLDLHAEITMEHE